MQFEAGRTDEFQEGEIKLVQLDGKELGIIRWRGKYHAVRNVCPHTGGYVCGFVRAHLAPGEAAGSWEVRHEQPVLACAWHHYEYDLHSGRCVADPTLRIKMYPASVREDGVLCVEIPHSRETAAPVA